MIKLLSYCVELYRDEQLDRLDQQKDGSWVPRYTTGPLRGRIRCLRIPVPALWACDLILAGRGFQHKVVASRAV